MLLLSALDYYVERWTRAWSGRPAPTPGETVYVPWWWVAWIWLMQLQICVMYVFTGAVKADSDYLTGTALYWVFNDLEITRWSYAAVPVPLFVCKLMTWTTLIFEAGFLFLVWVGARPRWMVVAGYVAHVCAYLWLKASLGQPLLGADLYLLLMGLAMVGLLFWLRWETGKWSGVADEATSAASGRAVLVVAALLHEVILLFPLRLLLRDAEARGALAEALTRDRGLQFALVVLALLTLACVGLAARGARWRWLLVVGYAAHAAAGFLLRRHLGDEIGFWAVYHVVVAGGLLAALAWLAAREGRWLPAAGAAPSAAEVGRWVLMALAVQHVALLVYRASSSVLVDEPHWGLALVISLLLFSGPSWRWVLLAGVGLHLGILLTIEIGWFSQVTLCFYLLFVPGEKMAWAWDAAVAWLRGPPRAEEAAAAVAQAPATAAAAPAAAGAQLASALE
jgi:hypothetical protein